MNKQLVTCVVALLLIVTGAHTTGHAEIVYAEDFSYDPQFTTSYSPQSGEYFSWNSSEELYEVRLLEQPNGYKFAYSPLIPRIENGSFSFSADVSLVDMNGAIWIGMGWCDPTDDYTTYGGIYTLGMSSNSLVWDVGDLAGNEYPAGNYLTPGAWYTFSLDYDHDATTASFSITNRETNAIYFSIENIPFDPHGFDHVWIGTRTIHSDGQYVEMQCDNIVVSREGLIQVHLDIKPGSCPNPLNVGQGRMDGFDVRGGSGMAAGDGRDPAISEAVRGKKAVLPVAILGTDEFDVAQVDATTVVLEGVPVVRWNYEDVATPVAEDAEECECNTDGPDGYVDMTLKFYRAEIIAALGEVYDGDVIPLTISGQLIDGTPFEGVDCVVILGDNLPMADVGGDDVPSIPGVNNFPNPFNPVTTISFSLPIASHVSLEVYNVMGQRVTTVADGFYEAGVHACEWDGSAVASGVYFYRIETPELVETKKMMLLK